MADKYLVCSGQLVTIGKQKNFVLKRFKVIFVFQEEEELPEDCIPDLPENKDAREFLAHAPSKGLWMPLGKEVKVMKCKMSLVFPAL